ncbi:MAG: hypothetical protein AAB368_13695, partial [bacterium]
GVVLGLAAAALAGGALGAYEPTDWQVTAAGYAQGVRMKQVHDELLAIAEYRADAFEATYGGSAARIAVPAAFALGGGLAVDYRAWRHVLLGARIEGAASMGFADVSGEGDDGELLTESWIESFSALPILFGGRWEAGDPDDVTYGLGLYVGPARGRGTLSYMGSLEIPASRSRSNVSSMQFMKSGGLAGVVTVESALRVSRHLSLLLGAAYRRLELDDWEYDDAVGGPVTALGKPLKIAFTGFGLSLATRWHF